MHPAISTSYLLPAILLNPVLFLHSLNTILSRILPPIITATTVQPAPYSTLGPSANHPHVDMHTSDNLCWSYTVLMVCAQLVAFGSVSQSRAEGKEKQERKEEKRLAQMEAKLSEGQPRNGHCRGMNGHGENGFADLSTVESHMSDETEDEVILWYASTSLAFLPVWNHGLSGCIKEFAIKYFRMLAFVHMVRIQHSMYSTWLAGGTLAA